MTDVNNDDHIKDIVHSFYGRVRKDERLGYLFDDFAKVDWPNHLPTMVDFWSNLVFHTGRYRGRPFREHWPLPIEKNDFNLWLGYWHETIDARYKGERAEFMKDMARKVAASFNMRFEMAGRYAETE